MLQLINNLLSNFGAACQPAKSFFGLPTWYRYLEGETDMFGKCNPVVVLYDTNTNSFNFNAVLPIGLAVIDMLLRIAGMVAVGFIIYAGFQYVLSQGEPDATREAKDGIINALIGLGIVIIAASVVGFIGNSLNN